MKRTALIALLLGAYAGMFSWRLFTTAVDGFDAVSPQAREVERSLADQRYEQALPLAKELQTKYPNEPLIELWLAAIYRGMQRYADEAQAWERFIEIGSAPDEACPGLANAYAMSKPNQPDLAAHERCTTLDARDPERLLDYGVALELAGKRDEALAVFRRAAELDPSHPAPGRFIDALLRAGGQP
jgi:tetratricopeptide (TPR) repeat protein